MKKYRKYFALLTLVALVAITLTGCSGGDVNSSTPPHGGLYGWIFQWIGLPLQNVMLHTAHAIGGANGAGWGIVIITLVIRLILLPLMLMQQKKSVTQQEKMSRLQPQMKLIQEGMRHKPITPEQQMQLSTWQRELYSKNNVSLTGGIGPKQDFLLPHLEKGSIILIGATTENPYITINPAIRSRTQIFEVKPLSEHDIDQAITRALTDKENGLGNQKITLTPEERLFHRMALGGI